MRKSSFVRLNTCDIEAFEVWVLGGWSYPVSPFSFLEVKGLKKAARHKKKKKDCWA